MGEVNCNEPKKTITIDLWKALAIFVTAIIGSAGGSVWATLASVNSDHFAVSANTGEIKELKENYKTILAGITEIKVEVATLKGSCVMK